MDVLGIFVSEEIWTMLLHDPLVLSQSFWVNQGHNRPSDNKTTAPGNYNSC